MTRRPNVPLPFAGKRDPKTDRPLCCYCGTITEAPRRAWCSDECVERYLIAKGDQNAARRWLWRQDLGVCRACGLDTKDSRSIASYRACGYRVDTVEDLLKIRPFGEWDADHETPIVEGGALAPENLRTLCKACHKVETAALRKRLAAGART